MDIQTKITFDSFSAKGRATATLDNCHVETFGAMPGDTALVTLGKKERAKG